MGPPGNEEYEEGGENMGEPICPGICGRPPCMVISEVFSWADSSLGSGIRIQGSSEAYHPSFEVVLHAVKKGHRQSRSLASASVDRQRTRGTSGL